MKINYFLFFLIIVSSCSKDDIQSCGQEANAGLVITNYSDFIKYKNIAVGDVSYQTYYSLPNGNLVANYVIQTQIRNICNLDKPRIDYEVKLKNSDQSAFALGFIKEGTFDTLIGISPHGNPVDISPARNDYHYIFDYDLKGNLNDSTGSLTIATQFQFNSKGSFSKDSAYFFSNLDFMSCKITTHKSK